MKDLREFIDGVGKLGELKVIENANWEWELGAITYSIAKKAYPPALLFDKIEGYKQGFRVFTIPCSTDKRIALSFHPFIMLRIFKRGLNQTRSIL